MKKFNLLLTISYFYLSFCMLQTSHAQTENIIHRESRYSTIDLGLGMGLDYGGFGGNLTVYPHKNIGLFGGVGFNLAEVGYNFGGRIRLTASETAKFATPYLTAMYGYNAVVVIINDSDLNRVYYGPTFGGGIDLKVNRGTTTLGLLIPIRDQRVHKYMEELEDDYGADFGLGLFPIGITIGYKIRIY